LWSIFAQLTISISTINSVIFTGFYKCGLFA
jgi:hypothetical protein